MQGLELSRLYYEEYCAPLLAMEFPPLLPRVAAGLVGEGSECLGFDDMLSRDHDWGAAVCLWLSAEDFAEYGQALTQALAILPRHIQGYPARVPSLWGVGRTGVLEITDFYFQLLGRRSPPQSLTDWLLLPEWRLAAATSGQVFADPWGRFSAFRNSLLPCYPEDVRRKKLAARLAKMAQAGQYNYPRCLARQEYTAACLAVAEFMREAASAIHLLNYCYCPYYKWLHRSLKSLPVLGKEVYRHLAAMTPPSSHMQEATFRGHRNMYEQILTEIQTLCSTLSSELRRQNLCAGADFLLDCGVAIQQSIEDPAIRNMDVFLG